MPGGRPSDFTQAIADEICERMAIGENLTQICRDPHMPDRITVWRWREKHEEFRNAYTRAREAMYDRWEDELIEICDDGTNDWTEREIANGRKIIALDEEHVRRSTLRADTRKWLLSKLKPKTYGDKLAVGGSDDMPPLKVTATEARA